MAKKPSFLWKKKRTSTQLTSRRKKKEKLIQKFNFQIKARCHHSLVLYFLCLCDHTYHYHANNTPPPLWDKIFVYHFLRGFFFSFLQNAPNSIKEFSLNCFAVCIVNVVVIDCILLNWIFKKYKNILLDSVTKQQQQHLANILCKKKGNNEAKFSNITQNQ